MKENFIKIKKIKGKKFLFDSKNMILILKNVCEREKRFDYALEKVLEKIVTGEINKIRDNFINYI
ncbi:hypothetical protein [Anaerococcus sp. AGMB09787]|uniref:hypothetical protein n=1 Tax=Anaerococcus sp. AGMB09787 TaxID=2922869 RepID=UPI001FB03D16|nr:hypothetical protein [Anaerococcus sp. AGMB09787]